MTTRRRLVTFIATLAMTLGYLVLSPTPAAAQEADPSILVFSRTAGFRHSSIEAGITAIQNLAAGNGVTVDATEDPADFNEENLAQYSAVIWLSTTGDVLNAEQQAAFEQYIQSGGGYVGIHAASDTEYGWEWYGDLVGAYFEGHPPGTPQGTVITEDHAHPSTDHLDTRWTRNDEWYSFTTNPRNDVHVLQSLDESSYAVGNLAMGDHPISWCQSYDGGRAWYTGLGHTEASFAEAEFLTLIWGGIEYAAGITGGDCGATDWDNYQKVTLDDNTSNPMTLEVAPDGRVFYIDRSGFVQIIKTDGSIVRAATLDVTTVHEFGLTGLALDPNFDTNGWIYLTYSPSGSEARDVVSRFTVVGDALDLSSEIEVLEVTTQRDQCCHAGGELVFDTQGNLYLATGDNTNPFASDGFAPLDERDGRSAWDAQRSSANTNNLNGKIVRITPQPDGSYTIPDGNLFDEAADTDDLTRPEIFAMGFRNPFRVAIDPLTDTLLVADYGPDAGSTNPNRGPDGRVEWNIVDEPGFYGWPYCVGDNTPYIDYDFATATSGDPFDCEGGPVNDSPNNTGLTQLPPAIPADQWYGRQNTGTPEIGTGGAPMAGPVYRYDETNPSEVKWPEYWDGKAIFGEWNRTTNGMFSFQVDDDVDAAEKINVIFPGQPFRRLMDFDFGPDGALYFIEWGSGFGGNNSDSGIYRMEYTGDSRSPIARLSASTTNGALPLEVDFSAAGSYDPDGGDVTYAWDFDGDGTVDATDQDVTHVYDTAGDFQAQLTVTDDEGATGSSTITITAGNSAPVVDVQFPPNGGVFSFGDEIDYTVSVDDAEDATIDCDDIITQPALGHDEHAHPYAQYTGCSGSFPLTGDTGHVGANIFGIVTFTYTDQGGANGAGSLTTQEIVQLRLRHTEAEYYDATGRLDGSASGGDPGVVLEATTDVNGGDAIAFIEADDWWALDPLNLLNIDSVDFRVASNAAGGEIEIRVDAPDGPLVGTATVPVTGGWQVWETVTAELDAPVTSDRVYFVAASPTGETGSIFNVNWMEFNGAGVSSNQAPDVEITATPTEGEAPVDVAFEATAVDPDGDTDLTYAWTFGDGTVADGPSVNHLYESAGDYTATVTVTDSGGAASFATVDITVTNPAPGVCFDGRSDDFLGTSLNRDRWTVIRENQDLSVADSRLVLPLTATDIYGTGNTDLPNIVVQPLPSGAVTITTLVEGEFYDSYDQGGLILYGDDDNYIKFVFEGRADAAPQSRVFQFVEEVGGSPAETNGPALGADYPDQAYLQLRIDDAGIVTAYSSLDGVDWDVFTGGGDTPITGDVANLTNPQMGLFSLAGNNQDAGDIATFDWFLVSPDDTSGGTDPDDEFDGPELDLCRWAQSLRLDPSAYSFVDGELIIETGQGDIYQGGNSDPTNFILQEQPGDEWTVETKLDTSALAEQYQQAGLMIHADDDNYVKLDMVATNAAGGTVNTNIEMLSEIDGGIEDAINVNGIARGDLWLRLSRSGDVFEGSYSLDGENWAIIDQTVTNAPAAGGSVGIFTIGTNQSAPVPIAFDYFRVLDDVDPVDVTAPTIEANLLGLFSGELQPSVGYPSISGSGELVVTADQTLATAELSGLEPDGLFSAHLHAGTCSSLGEHYMDVPGGAMMPPNELWLTDPGETTFRADGNGEASPTGSAPWSARAEAQAIVVHSGDTGLPIGCITLDSSTDTVQVRLTAEDDMPGLVYTEYRINGGEWAEYTALVDVSDLGDYTVEYRASDTAGNVSDIGTATFSIVEAVVPLELVSVDVDPTAPDGANGWYVSPVTVTGVANDEAATIEFSVDGGDFVASTDGTVLVDADGTHTVEVRAVRDDEITDAQSIDFSIDATAPEITVDGLTDGATVNIDGSATVSATDATSGLDSLVVSVDGDEVGSTIDFAALSLGTHTLDIVATDVAGNVTSASWTFTTEATLADVMALIEQYAADGTIDGKTADRMLRDLDQAATFAERGKDRQALQRIEKAIATALEIDDVEVRTRLVELLLSIYNQ